MITLGVICYRPLVAYASERMRGEAANILAFILIHEIIRDHKEILSTDLWHAYLTACKKLGKHPVRERTFIKYRRKLLDMRLITAERALGKGRGNVNIFKPA